VLYRGQFVAEGVQHVKQNEACSHASNATHLSQSYVAVTFSIHYPLSQ